MTQQDQVKELTEAFDAVAEGFSTNVVQVALVNLLAVHIRTQDSVDPIGMTAFMSDMLRQRVVSLQQEETDDDSRH